MTAAILRQTENRQVHSLHVLASQQPIPLDKLLVRSHCLWLAWTITGKQRADF